VACAADERFLAPVSAMLHSLVVSAVDEPLDIAVLHDEPLSAQGRASVEATVEGARREGPVMLRFVAVSADELDQFPAPRFPRTIWARALLPEVLPDAERVLYLDADTIVLDSAVDLWRTDLGDAPLAAVANPIYSFMEDRPRRELGIADPRRYLNSGVLLMNLEALRRDGFGRRLLEYARAHPHNHYPDQDALSVLYGDRHLPLHPRWNAQTTLWDLRSYELPFTPDEVREARAAPAIVHFVGPFKPWHYLCSHPYGDRYFKHLAATPWDPPPVEGRTVVNGVLRRLSPVWINRWYRARQSVSQSALYRRLSGSAPSRS